MSANETAQEQLPRLRRRYRPRVVSVLGAAFVGLIATWLIVNAVRTPTHFFDLFLVGLSIGLIYALIALGYSLVYGILQLINFAHGDVFMLGAIVTTSIAISWFGLVGGDSAGALVPAIVVMLVFVILMCGAINVTIERIAYKPLRSAPRLAPLITAIGVSFILQNIGLVFYGPSPVNIPDNILPQGRIFTWGSADYKWEDLIVLLVVVPTLLGLVYLVQRTKPGKAMRAVSQDKDASAMMGINVDRTISFTFLIGGMLAGVAGVMYTLSITSVQFDTGFRLGLFAFTAAVLGGIGNLPGAVLGALCIGMVEQFNNGLTWAAPGTDWTTSIIFSILILILVFRPEGLLGERTPEGA